jgi:hypothetical protein
MRKKEEKMSCLARFLAKKGYFCWHRVCLIQIVCSLVMESKEPKKPPLLALPLFDARRKAGIFLCAKIAWFMVLLPNWRIRFDLYLL